MQKYTIFDTPVVATICHYVSRGLLRLAGWKVQGELPNIPKYVLIAAPHTSNWDFYFTLLMAFHYRLKIYWMGKNTLFSSWRGPIMRWLGGISVDRSAKQSLVQRTIDAFNEAEKLTVVIPPEGTREKVRYWKSGFYHIANGANVPIVLGYLNFPKKEGGLGPIFTPTGDFDKDLEEIRSFYLQIEGKATDKFCESSVVSEKNQSDK